MKFANVALLAVTIGLVAAQQARAGTIATLDAGYSGSADTTLIYINNTSSVDFTDAYMQSGSETVDLGPILAGTSSNFSFSSYVQGSAFGFDPDDYIVVPTSTVYTFSIVEGGQTLTSNTFSEDSTGVDFLGYGAGDSGLTPTTVATISDVPEPVSIALFGTFLVGLGVGKRRKFI